MAFTSKRGGKIGYRNSDIQARKPSRTTQGSSSMRTENDSLLGFSIDFNFHCAGVPAAGRYSLETQSLCREVGLEEIRLSRVIQIEGTVGLAFVGDDLETMDLSAAAHSARPKADAGAVSFCSQFDLDPGRIAIAVGRPRGGEIYVYGLERAPRAIVGAAIEVAADAGDMCAILHRSEVGFTAVGH